MLVTRWLRYTLKKLDQQVGERRDIFPLRPHNNENKSSRVQTRMIACLIIANPGAKTTKTKVGGNTVMLMGISY
jgi:hypothetical protein